MYYSVGWTLPADSAAVFTTIRLPGGGIARLLDKRVHMAALDRAGEKLAELTRRSGQRDSE